MATMNGPNDELSKLTIASAEAGYSAFTVAFNPKEVSIDKAVPWQKHKNSKSDQPLLEFTAAEPKTLSFELLFDGYAGPGGSSTSVLDKVNALEKFAKVVESLKRPPICEVAWGSFGDVFKGVVETLAVKYTMFLHNGTPVRATCTLKFKQADKAEVKSA